MKLLEERLTRGEVIILDGATGTELDRRGVPMHGHAWSAAALRTHSDIVRQVHEDYIRAGADIVTTNTFATARHVLDQTELRDAVRELNTAAVELARAAREAAAPNRPVYIAGSMSTSFVPPIPASQKSANYREQATILAEAGVDVLLLEMMGNVDEATLAIEAAVSTGLPTWVGYSCKIDGATSEVVLIHGEGETFGEALDSLLPLGGSLHAIMHTEAADTIPALNVLRQRSSLPLGAYPHSGNFIMPNWVFENMISPEEYAEEAPSWVEIGAQVIGGCCGIGPDHIRLLRHRLPTIA